MCIFLSKDFRQSYIIVLSSNLTSSDIEGGGFILPKGNTNLHSIALMSNVEPIHVINTARLTCAESKLCDCFTKMLSFPERENEKMEKEAKCIIRRTTHQTKIPPTINYDKMYFKGINRLTFDN